MKRKVKIYGKKEPYIWQKEAHDIVTSYINEQERFARTLIVKAARQRFGKSAFVKAELLRFALSQNGSINAYVSPALNLARKMYKEIKKGANAFITSCNGQSLEIEFDNGSIIRFHSEQQGDALRGYTVTGVCIIDEGSSFRDNTYYELIAPWVTVHKALTIIVSTPKYETGFFYKSYTVGIDGSNPYYNTIDWVNKFGSICPISAEDLAKKSSMPSAKWMMEFEGRFMKAESSVLGDFSKCLISMPNPQPQAYYIGLDFGGGNGGDYTSLVAFDEAKNMVFCWADNMLTPTEQVNEIARILTPIKDKIKKLNAESNSIGITYIDMLRRKGFNVDRFVTTNASKRRIIDNVEVAIRNGDIGILNDPELITELNFIERKVVNGLVKFSAPTGMHDDRAMAMFIAYDGISSNKFDFFIA